MRVNVYAEEMTNRIELVEKNGFTGIRFYTYLPVTQTSTDGKVIQVRGPFKHHEEDDDSAAVTFWGKRDLRPALVRALELLDEHDKERNEASA